MKHLLLAKIILLLASSACVGQSPEQQARSFFSLMQQQKWPELAAMFDPEELKDFKSSLAFLFERPDEQTTLLIQQFLGPAVTPEDVGAMSDVDFFTAFVSGIMNTVAASGQFNFTKIEVLGTVSEGDQIRHVVVRTHITFGRAKLQKMEVISCHLREGKWLLAMQGQMKGVADQLKATLGR